MALIKNPTSRSSSKTVNIESMPGSTPSSSPTTYYMLKRYAWEYDRKCEIWEFDVHKWFETLLHTHPFQNTLGHVQTGISLLEPFKRFKEHLLKINITSQIQLNWTPHSDLHKTKERKGKRTLVVSNLMAERLLLHLTTDGPILQLRRYSAVGSWECIAKHVLSPDIA